jgi:hypothetical protein
MVAHDDVTEQLPSATDDRVLQAVPQSSTLGLEQVAVLRVGLKMALVGVAEPLLAGNADDPGDDV